MTAPFHVETDHIVIPIGDHHMELRDTNNADNVIATAKRTDAGSPWHIDINMDGAQDFETTDRTQAINHMIFDRPDVDPNQPGYSTLVPHGLTEQP
jgi:hypothetical protein